MEHCYILDWILGGPYDLDIRLLTLGKTCKAHGTLLVVDVVCDLLHFSDLKLSSAGQLAFMVPLNKMLQNFLKWEKPS